MKRALGWAVAGIVALGGCYLGGYLHGRSEIARLSDQLDAARKAAQSAQSELSERLVAERRRVAVLEARRNLDRAITALDARNFGIAEQEVRRGAEQLSAAGVPGPLASLATTLQSFHLVATEDLGPQRKQIADWVLLVDQQSPIQPN